MGPATDLQKHPEISTAREVVTDSIAAGKLMSRVLAEGRFVSRPARGPAQGRSSEGRED
jgi:hypothetical protein